MSKNKKREKEKKRLKGMKLIFVCLLLTILFGGVSNPIKTQAQENIFGEAGVGIDAKTGQILYDKGANDQHYPASITKILTAILLEENIKDDQKLTVSEKASYQECSCLVVESGEELSKKDALHALMIKSANDVSVVVAENVAGSVEEFAKMMNKKAKELGAKNSNFVTPNGLHDPEHKTTAYDIAMIMRGALKYPNIIEAMQVKEYVVKTNVDSTTLTRNDHILDIPNAVGGKTGFTDQAGNTLAVYLKDGEKEIISVVMQSTSKNKQHYKDIETMANESFKQLKVKKMIEKNSIVGKNKVLGEKVSLIANDEFSITYTGENERKIEKEIVLYELEEKTIPVRTKVGEMKISMDKKVIKTIPLLNAEEIVVKEKPQYQNIIISITTPLVIYLLWTMIIRTRLYANKRKKKLINN